MCFMYTQRNIHVINDGGGIELFGTGTCFKLNWNESDIFHFIKSSVIFGCKDDDGKRRTNKETMATI